MNKRMFELILIVSIIFIGIYFLLYHLYFDSVCLKRDGLIGENKQTTMILMGQCKDSYVCNIENISYDDLNRNVVNWECNKSKFNYFEVNFYQKKVSNLFN